MRPKLVAGNDFICFGEQLLENQRVNWGSLKFCLLLSLVCHVAGYAAFKIIAPSVVPRGTKLPATPSVVIFTTEPATEKMSAPPGKSAKPALDDKFRKMFAAEKFIPLKPLAMPATMKTATEEKLFAGLRPGETEAAAFLAAPSSNSVVVGTRISRVFADANVQPGYASNPKPEYPAAARRLRQEGVVWLRVHVTERGQPDRVAVLRSSGFDTLDEAAVGAVRRWEFTPAQLGDAPVESEIDFPIQFKLD